jgi:outer membrane receptor protein involved in Fe transport
MTRNMRFVAILILMAWTTLTAIAQNNYPTANPGKISGKVMDEATGKPVEFATVVLKKSGETQMYKGGNTDLNGDFMFDNIPLGAYQLEVAFVGYKAKTIPNIALSAQAPQVVMSQLSLSGDEKILNEVVIQGQKEFIQTTPDAIIIKPEANVTQAGSTATDVLQNVPSVQVDQNGNISMRGGRPNILINGRSSGFGDMRRGGGMMGFNPLDQINAEDIESISISNNPSARFDAEGGGGLIDIKLKRDRQLGTHGQVNLGYGAPRNRVNGNLRINHRTKNMNMFLSYGARFDKRKNLSETDRTTYDALGESITQLLDQEQNGINRNQNHNIRIGGDYYFTEKTTLQAEASYSTRFGKSEDFLESLFFDENGDLAVTTNQKTNNEQKSNNFEYNLTFRHEFKKAKQNITASFVQVFSDDDGESLLAVESTETTQNRSRLSESDNQNINTNFQLDYAHPIGSKGLLETGYKLSLRDLNTDSDFENKTGDVWERDDLLSNEFEFQEQVHAGYIAYKNSLGKWDYSVGIRAEQVMMEGNVFSTQPTVGFEKDFLNFFPTARIAYNVDDTQFLKISYNKRISRPNFGDLNPFRDITNPLNIRTGNPDLNPEFNHNFELGYSKVWEKYTFSPTVFYRHQTDVVQRITTLLDDDSSITISKPENIGLARNYGIELMGTAQWTKWWDMNTSFSMAQNEIEATEEGRGIDSRVSTWNARFNSNFTFWENSRLSVNAFYNSPRAIAQGTIRPIYAFGIGFQKPILNKKGSIGFNVRDIFYTMRFGSETRGANFIQTTNTRRDTRMVMVNFRYRF